MNEEQQKLVMIIGGAFIALVAVGAFVFYTNVLPSNEEKLNKPAPVEQSEVTDETKKLINDNIVAGCTSNSGSEQYCRCVADNFTTDMDKKRLDDLIAYDKETDEAKKTAFLTPFTQYCLYQ